MIKAHQFRNSNFINVLYQVYEFKTSQIFTSQDFQIIILLYEVDYSPLMLTINMTDWLICDEDGLKVYEDSWVREFYSAICGVKH